MKKYNEYVSQINQTFIYKKDNYQHNKKKSCPSATGLNSKDETLIFKKEKYSIDRTNISVSSFKGKTVTLKTEISTDQK